MTTITREKAQKIIDAADEVITALAGTNEDIHPDNYTKMCEAWNFLNDNAAPPEVVRELARIALASLEAEPVAWTDEQELRDVEKDGFGYLFTVNPITPNADPRRVIKLYTAPPAPVVPDEKRDAISAVMYLLTQRGGTTAVRITAMIDKYRLDDLRLESGEKGELARWVIQLQTDLDSERRKAGNSPVIPDGYVLVPIVPTEDMIINGFESVPDPHFSDEKEWKEYEALSGCRQAARRAELCWAAMIKAAPKQENI